MAYLILRSLFVIYLLAAFVLTIFYLRYRRCSPLEIALWGGLAFFLPVFGPFFVIAARPGPKKRARRPRTGKM
jgi:4-amino-4-deoxy-L-arabinose transferase-like glycosyltransferase